VPPTYQRHIGELVVRAFDRALASITMPLDLAGDNVRVDVGDFHAIDMTKVVPNLEFVHPVV